MKKTAAISIISAILLTGCGLILIQNETPADPVSVFEYFWNDVNAHYVFMDLKSIDWQGVYDTYRPQVTSDMSDEELYAVLADSMNELRDGHCNIMAPFTRSRYPYAADSPLNFNKDIIMDTVEEIYYTGVIMNGFITRGADTFGYMYYSSFMDVIISTDVNYVLDRFRARNVKGIILDIRGNTGGMLLNVTSLIGFFTDTEKEIFDTWIKTDPETYTFTGTTSVAPSGNPWTGPVVLLTNRTCYSAASFTATGFKALDNVIQIGDQTGGGMGLPTGAELPNGWEYRISTTVNLRAESDSIDDLNDPAFNYEPGVPPDVKVDMDPTDESSGVDTILEAAIQNILDRI